MITKKQKYPGKISNTNKIASKILEIAKYALTNIK